MKEENKAAAFPLLLAALINILYILYVCVDCHLFVLYTYLYMCISTAKFENFCNVYWLRRSVRRK